MAENTANAPKFVCPNCLPKPKSWGFLWKKASLGVCCPCTDGILILDGVNFWKKKYLQILKRSRNVLLFNDIIWWKLFESLIDKCRSERKSHLKVVYTFYSEDVGEIWNCHSNEWLYFLFSKIIKSWHKYVLRT